MLSDTDRDKYCVLRIVDFYQRQPTDLADYFLAAWRFKHRAALGKAGCDAGRHRGGMQGQPEVSGDGLGAAGGNAGRGRADRQDCKRCGASCRRRMPTSSDVVRGRCEAMRDWVVQLRDEAGAAVRQFGAQGGGRSGRSRSSCGRTGSTRRIGGRSIATCCKWKATVCHDDRQRRRESTKTMRTTMTMTMTKKTTSSVPSSAGLRT